MTVSELYNDIKKFYNQDLLKMELKQQFLVQGLGNVFCMHQIVNILDLWTIQSLLLLNFAIVGRKKP